MGKMALCYNDVVRTATAITSDSEIATLPAVNVGTLQIAEIWKTQPAITAAYLLIDLGASVSIGVVTMINTNQTATGTWRIRVSTADATGVAGNALDTGVINAGVDIIYKKAVKVLTTPVTGRYLRLDLSDAAVTFISVGRVAALTVFVPTYNYSPNAQLFYRDWSRRFNGDDGSAWAFRGSLQRGMLFSLPATTDAERTTHGEALIRATGMSQDMLIVRDQASTNLGRDSIWGLMEEMPVWSLFVNNYSNIVFKIMERL
jgi:hypothetical protein